MSSRKTVLTITTILALALAACSDDDKPGPDATTGKDVGADASADKGPAPDQEGVDQMTVDLKVVDQNASFDKATPDMPLLAKDLKPFVLDSGYTVLYRFDDPVAAGAAAFNFSGTKLYLFEFGGSPAAGKVSEAAIDVKTGKPGALSTVISFSPGLTGTLFASSYVALSPKLLVAAGYTESTSYDGEIFWGDKGIKTPKKIDKAKGNYDAIFLDDKTLLINGTGAGTAQSGQGVYLYEEGKTPRLLIKDMGTFSGYMVLGEKTVYAGGYFTSANKVYGFSLAEIKDAVAKSATLSSTTDGDLIYTGNASDAATLGDDLVLVKLDSSWKFQAVAVVPVTVAGDKLMAGTAKEIITGGGTAGVSKLAGAGKHLGLYIADGSKKELAIIERK